MQLLPRYATRKTGEGMFTAMIFFPSNCPLRVVKDDESWKGEIQGLQKSANAFCSIKKK
jgi:hypothetical protein